MGDLSDGFKDLRQATQARHAEWKRRNLDILAGCEFAYEVKEEVVLFRVPGKPRVDFYPSTGRWRIVTQRQMYTGGAEKFLKWYREIQ